MDKWAAIKTYFNYKLIVVINFNKWSISFWADVGGTHITTAIVDLKEKKIIPENLSVRIIKLIYMYIRARLMSLFQKVEVSWLDKPAS